MGLFDGLGGLGYGMLGLGALSDAFGAYSQYSQQQKMRELYKRQQDPAYIMGQANQYYGQNLANLQSALPQLERASINPEIAMRGISGGAAQGVRDQVVAQYQQQAWQDALNRAQGGLSGAGQMIGQTAGSTGGTAGALQALLLYQALQGRNSGGGSVGGTDTTNLGASLPYYAAPSYSGSILPMQGMGQGMGSQLDFGFGSNPYGSMNLMAGAY